MDLNRAISGMICLLCFVLAHHLQPDGGVFLLLRWIVWPMALIWFGDALGSAKGFSVFHPVTTETPARVVKLVGWVFLLLLSGYLLYCAISGSPPRS